MPLEVTPTLLYALGAVGVTWLARQGAASWFLARAISANAAIPSIAQGAGLAAVAAVGFNLAANESPLLLGFNLFVVVAQAGGLWLSLRLAEVEQSFGPSGGRQ